MRKCFLTLVGLATAFVGAWFTYAADQGQPSDRSAATTARGSANKVTATGTVEPEELFNVYADNAITCYCIQNIICFVIIVYGQQD